MRAVATICNGAYSVLLPHWLSKIKRLTDMPVYVFTLTDTVPVEGQDCNFIPIDSTGNPFPVDIPDHACAEKLRIFKHLPAEVTEVLFLDIDVMVLNDFWSNTPYFDICREKFVATLDLFVGYKERMEDEFQPFDPSFRMKFLPDGRYHYFNTGVFFASRAIYAEAFDQFLEVWKSYVETLGRYPSIFDQNIFNYCVIRFGMEVEWLPIQCNCLRQYDKVVEGGRVLLNGLKVNAMHFNGGTIELKLARWLEFERELEVLG